LHGLPSWLRAEPRPAGSGRQHLNPASYPRRCARDLRTLVRWPIGPMVAVQGSWIGSVRIAPETWQGIDRQARGGYSTDSVYVWPGRTFGGYEKARLPIIRTALAALPRRQSRSDARRAGRLR